MAADVTAAGGRYSGPLDPRLSVDLQRAGKAAESFCAQYRGTGRLQWLEAPELMKALTRYEDIHQRVLGVVQFAELYVSAHNRCASGRRLLDQARGVWRDIFAATAFFEREMAGISMRSDLPPAMAAALAPFRTTHRWAPPRPAGEAGHRVLTRLSGSMRADWAALYGDALGAIRVPGSTGAPVPIGRALSPSGPSADPDVRRGQTARVLEGIGRNRHVFTHILNAVARLDNQVSEELGFASAQAHAHARYRIRPEMVQGALAAVRQHTDQARALLGRNAWALGVDALHALDLVGADRGSTATLSVNLQDAEDLLRAATAGIHPGMEAAVARVFAERRIDAEPRDDKDPGACCRCLGPDQTPGICMSYTNDWKSFFVLCHEVGHAVHYELARENPYVAFYPPPMLEEAAATFFELLLTDHVLHLEAFGRHRAEVLAAHLNALQVTIFRQAVVTGFEAAVHEARESGPLSGEMLGDIWLREHRCLYGDSVQWDPVYAWAWALIPHLVHRPFRCCNYVLGNLLAICLFRRYQREEQGAVPGLLEMFRAGGAKDPDAAAALAGVNLAKDDWHQPAFSYLDQRLAESLEQCGPDR